MDRAGQFAVVATREALADSGLGADLDRSRLGVSLGSAIGTLGALTLTVSGIDRCWKQGLRAEKVRDRNELFADYRRYRVFLLHLG